MKETNLKDELYLKYESGCRGEYPYKSRLHCLYNRTASPFLILAPLKMEEISFDPYMVLYHDVLYEDEVVVIQSHAKSSLFRAKVFDENTQSSVSSDFRTGKVAWLDERNEIFIRINERIKDMTGFDLEGSDNLQVVNYGLGGHYDPHYDFFPVIPVSSSTFVIMISVRQHMFFSDA